MPDLSGIKFEPFAGDAHSLLAAGDPAAAAVSNMISAAPLSAYPAGEPPPPPPRALPRAPRDVCRLDELVQRL